MNLVLHNSLSGKKESFMPLDSSLVKMYVCGPTVYDYPHLGNARSAVVYDILYRILILKYGKKQVKYVRNITDIDDKIIDKAAQLKIKIFELTNKTAQDFHDSMNYLNCLTPSLEPKATEHVQDMIMMIEKLISWGSAYASQGHVYFDVSSCSNYTGLSGRKIEDLIPSVRIEQSSGKKQEIDFVLWKPSKEKEEGASFDSPWGRGRPGWHIECSAMSHRFLGENFDIHGGGADLIFPHHTNEIAQSTCAYPGSRFATYWVHNGFLTSSGEKMSKSLGNFVTVKDLMEKQISGEIVRLFLISANYRKPLDYNQKALKDAERQLAFWAEVIGSCAAEVIDLPEDFISALKDDLNTPLAIKLIHDYAKNANLAKTLEDKNKYASMLLSCAQFLGLLENVDNVPFNRPQEEIEEIELLINERLAAKLNKDWKLADDIRDKLKNDFKVILEDRADGTTSWK